MITKAILELNACIHALYDLRTSAWISKRIQYRQIFRRDDNHLAKRIFSDYMYLEARCMLANVTNATTLNIYTKLQLNEFIKSYLEKNNMIIPNKMADALVEYYWGTKYECRRCSVCGRLMQEGYCQDGGYRYYCSDDCLHHDFTDEEWNEECDNNDQSYWTQWY